MHHWSVRRVEVVVSRVAVSWLALRQPPMSHVLQMNGGLGFNSILSMQVAAISCLKKFKVC